MSRRVPYRDDVEPITTELVDDKRKSDARGRRIIAAERRAELLAAYAASGMTQRAFARREGVNFHTFIGWLQRRGGAGRPAPTVRFQELRVSAAPKAALEVVLPGGWIVRGHDVAAVAELARALRG